MRSRWSGDGDGTAQFRMAAALALLAGFAGFVAIMARWMPPPGLSP